MSGDGRAVQVVEVATAELDGLRAVAEERAALLRVAALVAQDASPAEVFGTVVTEASRLLRGQAMTLSRFEGAGELVVVASCYGPAPVGDRVVFAVGFGDHFDDEVGRAVERERVPEVQPVRCNEA